MLSGGRNAYEGEGLNITVIGPVGGVGRQIVQQIVVNRLLQHDQVLTLVGNGDGASGRAVYGLAADLRDAYSEFAPRLEIALHPDEIRGDLIVMAAGATLDPALGSAPQSRDALTERNAPIFKRYAEAIAVHGHGHEIVLCISNPNELAVSIFAKHLGRNRVIGMGSYLDSLRFRMELAVELGVPRQAVHAFVAGEHGTGAVPLWSNVHVYGFEEDRLASFLAGLTNRRPIARFPEEVAAAHRSMKDLVAAGKVREAYTRIDAFPPDVRAIVRPFVTHYSGAKTLIGTARATMEFLHTITQGNDALISGQVALDGEVYGIRGTIGVPFVVGNRGVDRIFEIPLNADERALLCRSAEAVEHKYRRFTE